MSCGSHLGNLEELIFMPLSYMRRFVSPPHVRLYYWGWGIQMLIRLHYMHDFLVKLFECRTFIVFISFLVTMA